MLFDERLYDYADQYSSTVPFYLQELLRETALTTVNPFMASGPVLGRFLTQISQWIKPNRILEIGSFTGYSALCLAEGLKTDGTITCIEVNEEYESIIRKYFALAHKSHQLDLIIGDAIVKTGELAVNYDLIFIDANKQHNDLLFEKVLPLLNQNGYLFIDNTLWYGNVLEQKQDKETQAIHQFNKKLSEDSRVKTMILPIRDGLTLVQKSDPIRMGKDN